MSKKLFHWRYCLLILLVLVVAAVFRFVDLETKPLHHDESIHAYFSWNLFKNGVYEYHPLSHGPLLYYLIDGSFHLFGVSDAASRLPAAIFGLGLVGLLFSLKNLLSKRTVILIALLAATSPLLIYVSRFARHDMISLFCTLLLIIATLNYLKKPKPLFVYLGILALAFSYVNHELTYLTGLIWLMTTLATVGLAKLWPSLWSALKNRDIYHLLLAVVIALYVVVLFYSSFGHFFQGLIRALPNPHNPDSALGYWIAQHDVKRGGQPVYFYLLMLPLYEIIPFVLGLAGLLLGLYQRNWAWRFVSIWALLSLIAYSIAGEKMPWLTVHVLLPLMLTTGFLLDWLLPKLNRSVKIMGSLALGLLFSLTIFNSYRLAFLNPANPVELAVYVQTQPIVKQLAQALTNNRDASLTLGPDLAWPLVWYLRDRPYTYNGSLTPTPTNAALLSLDEAAKNNLSPYTSSEQLPFRSWWVPDQGYPGFNKLMRYYFLRQSWNDLGSYDFLYLKK